MNAAGVVLVLAGALVVQTSLARFVPGAAPVDLVLVAVVYAGLRGGPIAGLLAGTFGGLVQDAMSSGVIGIGGLAKTTVGFMAGVVGTQFIVAGVVPRLVVFAGATLLHAGVFMGLYEVLGLRDFVFPGTALAAQSVSTAVLGVVALHLAELLPGAADRRRAARPRLRR